MPLTKTDYDCFRSILPLDEFVAAADSTFKSHTLPWSLSYDQCPSLALIPSSLSSLQAVIKYLYEHDKIDFAIRGRGVGSASAKDVIVCMTMWTEITFDAANLTVELGAGLDWGEVETQLAKLAPGYVVVGSRCPYVGVTGSTLAGGLSWLSHELGLGSDPRNFLDAQIVLHDGRVTWASDEPELMWALRGGGGNFGVVTTLRLRAHPAPTTIFAGLLMYPPSSLRQLSKGLSKWVHDYSSPKTALHMFIFDFSAQELHGEKDPTIVALIYDALGEDHARNSDEGFKWLFETEGVRENGVQIMTLPQVHELQRSTEKSHGTARSWLQAALMPDSAVDDTFLERAWNWYNRVLKESPELALGTFALFEVMQLPSFTSAGGRDKTAWPHGGKGRQHVMQMSVGGAPPSADDDGQKDTEKLRKLALDILEHGAAEIEGTEKHAPGDYLPNFLLESHDISAVFAEHWGRVRQAKRQYDPKGRFGRGPGGFIPPADT